MPSQELPEGWTVDTDNEKMHYRDESGRLLLVAPSSATQMLELALSIYQRRKQERPIVIDFSFTR
jgi:hypothetical protein